MLISTLYMALPLANQMTVYVLVETLTLTLMTLTLQKQIQNVLFDKKCTKQRYNAYTQSDIRSNLNTLHAK